MSKEKTDLRKSKMQTLESFFKGYAEKNGYQKMVWFATGFCVFLMGVFMVLPYQLWDEDFKRLIGVVYGFSIMTAVTYLGAYLVRQGQEAGKRGFGEVLRFLPVSKGELFLFRMKKLVCFQAKVYTVIQILQLFFSVFCLQQVAWGNVFYPLMIVFLVPVLTGAFFILARK